MGWGFSKMGRIATVAAVLAAYWVAPAHGALLQNDGFTPGDQSNCQLGFAAGESAAAAFSVPPADYPIRIDSLQVLGCDSTVDVNLQVFPDDLDADPEPDGGALYTSPDAVPLVPGLQNLDISGGGTFVSGGGLRVAVTGATEGVRLATDAEDGSLAQPNNSIFAEGAWHFSDFFGFTRDFVIRANYTSLSGVEITKKPKETVKTSKRKALVKFEFEIDGSNLDFECKLDGGGFKDCSSPHQFKVGKGSHTFAVRAVSGDVKGDPASYTFKVKRK
jgi:hypothetical protein